jgi:ribosome-associated translation inhibitor RaiA
MQIQVNTDSNIPGSESLTRHVEDVVESVLGRFSDRITRVEVHLNDVNGQKSGDDDHRCMMEARLSGLQPIAITHEAATLEESVDGAAKKLQRSLDHALGKLSDK